MASRTRTRIRWLYFVLVGLFVALSVFLASQILYAAEEVYTLTVPIDTVKRGAEGEKFVLATETVPENHAGKECASTLTVRNNESVHPGTSILVESASSIEFLEVERGEFFTETLEGPSLGSAITVSVVLGEDEVFSGGLDLEVVCTVPPTPTPSPTPTVGGTQTPSPTPFTTPVPTATLAPSPTPLPSPTPTSAVLPPEQGAVCIGLEFDPPLPDAISGECYATDIYVEAIGAEWYVLNIGGGVLRYEEQPLRDVCLQPDIVYGVSVGSGVGLPQSTCTIGRLPTGEIVGPQPSEPFLKLFLPWGGN